MRRIRSIVITPRGIAAPMTNAPKTACSPMRSVNHAPSAMSATPTTNPASASASFFTSQDLAPPSGGVVECARTKSDCPHGRAGQLLEMNNASEHWERCDTHGCAQKKRGFHQRSLFREKLGVMKE